MRKWLDSLMIYDFHSFKVGRDIALHFMNGDLQKKTEEMQSVK